MSLPKLPAAVFSHLGPVAVERVPKVDDADSLGECDFHARRIKVKTGVTPMVEWATLGHEMMHAVVCDAGGDTVITDAQTEWLCDVFGTYLAAAVAAGWIVVRVPKP
jgi:hypothetical protein